VRSHPGAPRRGTRFARSSMPWGRWCWGLASPSPAPFRSRRPAKARWQGVRRALGVPTQVTGAALGPRTGGTWGTAKDSKRQRTSRSAGGSQRFTWDAKSLERAFTQQRPHVRETFLYVVQGRPCGRPPAPLRPGSGTTVIGHRPHPHTQGEPEQPRAQSPRYLPQYARIRQRAVSRPSP